MGHDQICFRGLLLFLIGTLSAELTVIRSHASSTPIFSEHDESILLMKRRLLLDNGLAQTPQMGWNSYNHFPCKLSEELIKQTADAMVSTGLSALGYEYINLDDCWAELNRDSKGNLVPKASIFPSGMKTLADYVHSKGLKIGIYADAGMFLGLPLPNCLCRNGLIPELQGFKKCFSQRIVRISRKNLEDIIP